MSPEEYDAYRRQMEARERQARAEEARDKSREDAETALQSVVSGDGRVFGKKVPEPFPTLWTFFGTDVMRVASKHTGEVVGKAVAQATHSEAKGEVAKEALQYMVPLIPTGISANFIRTAHKKNRNAVLEPLAPLLAANKAAMGGGMLGSIKEHFDNGYAGNKLVDYALSKVAEDTSQNIKTLAINGIQPTLNTASTYLGNVQNPSEKQRKAEEFIANYGGKIGGAVAAGVEKIGKSANLEEELAATSYGKVLALQEMIRVNNLDNPSNVASSSDMSAVASSIEDIFQTYQKEQKLRPIPSHRMREVSSQLAEEMISGDLSALSLVNLVGKEGLLNEKKDGLVSSEKVAEIVKQETKIFSKNSDITSEDFLKNHENITLDDIKSHLQSKNIDERAITTFLVPESVLIEAGEKKEDIKALAQHMNQKVQEAVFTALINGIGKETDEQLENKGLSREAIVFVREHQGEGAESIAHVMQSKAGMQELKEVGLNLMGEESKSTLWQDAVSASQAKAKDHAWADKKIKKLVADASKGPRKPMDFAERDQGVLAK